MPRPPISPKVEVPASMQPLVARYGSASTALDAWALANGEHVPSMSNEHVEHYGELLKARADARSAVWAEWHRIHKGTHKDQEMPPEWLR